MLDLERLKDFFTYTVKIWRPDDKEAQREYYNFKSIFMDSKEVERRGAAYPVDYEMGVKEGEIDTGLPVIVYYDSANRSVSHEIYNGKLPYDFICRRWKKLKESSSS